MHTVLSAHARRNNIELVDTTTGEASSYNTTAFVIVVSIIMLYILLICRTQKESMLLVMIKALGKLS